MKSIRENNIKTNMDLDFKKEQINRTCILKIAIEGTMKGEIARELQDYNKLNKSWRT